MSASPLAAPDWRQERRQRILEAASAAFAERPYAAVQMDEVAKRAGIGKPTLYRYYRSKDDLYIAVFEAMLAGLDSRLETIRSTEITAAAALAATIRALVEVLTEQISALRALEGEAPTAATRWRHVYRGHRQAIDQALLGILEAGTASGEFRTVDQPAVASLILGMIRGGLMRGPAMSKPRLIAAVTDFALTALARRE